MTRTGGEETRKKILQKAEDLFAEKGFSGTSVDKIARAAQVNKALIYYYFKDKNDIVVSLFRNILEEMEKEFGFPPNTDEHEIHGKALGAEIDFLGQRRKILAVMLMEALKSEESKPFLFQCAELVFREHLEMKAQGLPREKQSALVYEFFTGFIPLLFFTVLQEKWAGYFGCDPATVKEDFLKAFSKTHLQNE
ncbi:MAG: TetR/AcrR family transcriptional regulator [Desulfobacteraceae bacterium]|nr:MAG: TetR/AcrR family transcriptional regulator [Desulfobacteraceae bacterium]